MTDPQLQHFQKCINTTEWMFLQSPVPFNILHVVTLWFGKANLEHRNFHFSWQEDDWKCVSSGTRKINCSLKKNNVWNGLICTGLVLSGDVCHHRNTADHFPWIFFTDSDRIKITVHNYHELADVPMWCLCFSVTLSCTHSNQCVQIKTSVRLPIFYGEMILTPWIRISPYIPP